MKILNYAIFRRSKLLGIVVLGVALFILCFISVYLMVGYGSSKWIIKLNRTMVDTRNLKPPQEENVFELEFGNMGARDLWVVWSAERLHRTADSIIIEPAKDGDFAYGSSFDCTKFGGDGKLVIFDFRSACLDDRFHAMLLKPGARVSCKQYPLISFGKLDKLSVYLTYELMVDGKFPLQDWMPYDLGNYGEISLSTNTHEFYSEFNQSDPAWKPGKGAPDFQRLHLDRIQFNPIKSFLWTAVSNTCTDE